MSELQAIKDAAETGHGFRKIAANTYHRYNGLTQIHTIVEIEHIGNGKANLKVKHVQEVEQMLENNVRLQNDFQGYKGRDLVQATAIPLIEHRKIMKQCGFEKGQYDRKRFKQIINSSDYSKFRTVPGKI